MPQQRDCPRLLAQVNRSPDLLQTASATTTGLEWLPRSLRSRILLQTFSSL